MLNDADFRLLLLERNPPGMVKVVRALERVGGISNPWAEAWSMYNTEGKLVCVLCGRERGVDSVVTNEPCEYCETFPLSAGSALMRGKCESLKRFWEATVVSSVPDQQVAENEAKAISGVVKVILVSEGLGNRRDMNYYGPEAMASACHVFEGKQCMLNHLGEDQEKNRPEGDVENVVGYYRGLHTETINTPKGPRLACCGELCFDLSQEGRNAYEKARTAIQYNQDFPGSDDVYFGLSINAAGHSEPRTMTVDGEEVDVNYVLEFEYARSCDAVTMPGRGGKFVALVESISGAKTKEVTMIAKNLKAALESLRKAEGEKDAEVRQKKVSEALKALESLEAELTALEAKKKKEEEDEAEAKKKEEEAKAKAEEEATAKGKKKGDEDEDEEEAASAAEAKVIAVKALIAESKLPADLFIVADLVALSFKEAKAKIEEQKRMASVLSKHILETLDVPAGHPSKVTATKEGEAPNAAHFTECN